MSRPFAAPPDLPPARAKALETAFLAVQKDPQYLQDAATLKVDVSPVGGEDVMQAIERMSEYVTGPARRLEEALGAESLAWRGWWPPLAPSPVFDYVRLRP